MTTAELIIPGKETSTWDRVSRGRAALLAGIGLLTMAIAAPYAQMYAYPQLVIPGDAAETLQIRGKR